MKEEDVKIKEINENIKANQDKEEAKKQLRRVISKITTDKDIISTVYFPILLGMFSFLSEFRIFFMGLTIISGIGVSISIWWFNNQINKLQEEIINLDKTYNI